MGRRRLWQRKGASGTELRYALWDTMAGMVFSEIVAYFIIVTAGATLFASGNHDVVSATEAASALRPLAGEWSTAFFAAGLIGAGVLAVPVLTASAAYGVAETFGWRSGLNRRPSHAPEFYAVIAAATVVGMGINFAGINPIAALVIVAVINGMLAAPLVVVMMLVSNDRKVMGERTNGRLLNAVGWVTAAVISLAALALIATTVLG